MKKYFLTLCVLLATLSTWAQAPYACITKGAVLEYATYNEEDKLSDYSRQVIKEVTDLGDGNYDFRIENSTISKPGQKEEGEDAFVALGEIRDGAAKVSISGMGTTVDVASSDPGIMSLPNKLAVGYQLPLGDVRVSLEGMAVVATITDNEVIGREEVTVPAGKFKCYIVRMVTETSMMGVSAISTTKTWYSRGVGIVKSETTMGNRQVSRNELVTFKK